MASRRGDGFAVGGEKVVARAAFWDHAHPGSSAIGLLLRIGDAIRGFPVNAVLALGHGFCTGLNEFCNRPVFSNGDQWEVLNQKPA